MSAADDDDREGDDKLASMRTVWLSMRDEEPSDKGLSALMAAAREKAGEMKDAEAPAESWWQKVLAVVRRPPVLALASVAILVSGALVVANRSDSMAVDETAEIPAPAATPAPDPELDRRSETQPAGSAALDFPAPGAAAAGPAIEAPPEEPANVKADAPAVKPRPARERPVERRPVTNAVKKAEEQPLPPPPPAPPRSPEPDAAVSQETASEPRAPATRAPTTKPRPEPAAGVGATSTGAMTDGESSGGDSKDKDEAASGRAQARVLQLVKQCESAAARGDCAAVKVLAARIRSEDASTYKVRVVKNASIARCLE